MIHNIVIPLHESGGKLKNNTELRYAIRSICENFKGEFRLAIVGKHLPVWLKGVEHIVSEKGLKKAVNDTSKRFPEGFYWWYDDYTLLLPRTPEQMKVTQASRRFATGSGGWAQGLEEIRVRLVKEGFQPWDYSRPHGCYWFDSGMVQEGFEDWPGMKGKFPWESWILSKRDWPRSHAPYVQYYGKFHTPPRTALYLNYNDAGNTPELRAWLSQRFPDPCRFESTGKYFFIHVPKTGGKSILAAQPMLSVESLVRHKEWREPATQAAWRSAGSPPVLAVVRHPLDRAVSAYHYFRARKDFLAADRPHIVLGEMCRHLSLSQFWEKVDILKMASVIKHLRTQNSFLKGAPDLRLMRFESLAADYADVFGEAATPLPHLNAAPRNGDPDLSPAALARIRKIYEVDFKHYYPEV